MDLGLRNKVALVAASSHGLGRAVAEELASEGASLIICGRNESDVETTAAAISKRSGVEILRVKADVSRPEDVTRLVDSASARFGHIDILITNAGGPPTRTFETLTREEWESATRLTL